ncbi:MAG: hypothetical protein RL338_673 [Chloroflexota bacterium]
MFATRVRTTLIASLLALAVAVPAQAAGIGGSEIVLRGTIADVHEDTFSGGVQHKIHLVKADGQSVALELAPGTKHPVPGTAMNARGIMRDGKLAVAAGGLTPATDAATTAAAAELQTTLAATTKRLAVILINFSDDTRQPFTVAQTEAAFFAASPAKSVHTFYQEQSYGAWDTVGDVLGYYTITADRTACNWSDWGTKGRAAATAAGVDLSLYTNVVHVWPGQASCGWAGLAYLPGTYSFLDGTISLYVATHELGHNYGAHHASTLNCTVNGVRVAIAASANCTANEYGDPFDTMGAAARLSHTWHRKLEAQLTTSDQLTVTTAGRYTVGVANSTSATPHRIVRVPRGDGNFFYLEFRQPGGLIDTFLATDPVVNGVSVRLNADTARVQSKLIDTTPATSSFTDAALAVGQTFNDPVSSVSITTVSVGPEGAVVDVAWGPDGVAPSGITSLAATPQTNGTMRLSWGAATDNVGVAGYEISRDGTTLTTVTTASYIDAAVTAGTSYTWTVRAYDAAGNLGPASSVTATVPTPDTSAPTTPANLKATWVNRSTIRLSWDAASDNVAVTGYRVYDNGTLIGSVTGLSFQYKVPRGTHSYTVRAIDAAGNLSVASTAVNLTK